MAELELPNNPLKDLKISCLSLVREAKRNVAAVVMMVTPGRGHEFALREWPLVG